VSSPVAMAEIVAASRRQFVHINDMVLSAVVTFDLSAYRVFTCIRNYLPCT
jgi:hypothetical protein